MNLIKTKTNSCDSLGTSIERVDFSHSNKRHSSLQNRWEMNSVESSDSAFYDFTETCQSKLLNENMDRFYPIISEEHDFSYQDALENELM